MILSYSSKHSYCCHTQQQQCAHCCRETPHLSSLGAWVTRAKSAWKALLEKTNPTETKTKEFGQTPEADRIALPTLNLNETNTQAEPATPQASSTNTASRANSTSSHLIASHPTSSHLHRIIPSAPLLPQNGQVRPYRSVVLSAACGVGTSDVPIETSRCRCCSCFCVKIRSEDHICLLPNEHP